MADEQYSAPRVSEVDELVGLVGPERERLFDEDVLAAFERLACHLAMGGRLGADDGRVDALDRERLVDVVGEPDQRETPGDLVQPVRASVADHRDVGVGQLAQNADVVDSPVAGPEDGDAGLAANGFEIRLVHGIGPASGRSSPGHDGRERQQEDLQVEPERLRAHVGEVEATCQSPVMPGSAAKRSQWSSRYRSTS